MIAVFSDMFMAGKRMYYKCTLHGYVLVHLFYTQTHTRQTQKKA